MSSYINPIAELLKNRVGPMDIVRGTGLAYDVGYRILHTPTAGFNAETVSIVHEWVCKTFGPCTQEMLFHPKNISYRGRTPGTGTPQSHAARVTVCSNCHYQTNPRLPTCTNCGEALS